MPSQSASSRGATPKEKLHDGEKSKALRLDPADASHSGSVDVPATTGNPFIRAPIRTDAGSSTRSRSASVRPANCKLDSYDWGDDPKSVDLTPTAEASRSRPTSSSKDAELVAKVPVGVSRLHEVVVPELKMEPIYWSPVNDVASVVRGTWFYYDNMLPVEVDVANLLEAGYVELRAWGETWRDELASAIEVGAVGEEKILHKLWPDVPTVSSKGEASRGFDHGHSVVLAEASKVDPEKDRRGIVAYAADLIDSSSEPDGPDNKASGSAPYGFNGSARQYRTAGVIYANERDAYILRPSLQPSNYYGRRPLANYINKGRKIGIRVVRGFDQQGWDRLQPKYKTSKGVQANQGVSTAGSGSSPRQRQLEDPSLAESVRPKVTDLVLVIHGIGQKLSERVESYHFTHSINSFRRDVNVELGTDQVKAHLRKDMGGIMVLPVNWRLTLSFEEGGYRPDDFEDDPTANRFTLQNITPQTLPNVRNIISDVMLDIPYYLSPEHNSKMLAAVTREANRVYRTWCANNHGFAEWGRVHIVAHSLGSVMALDILSSQPTNVNYDIAKLPMDADSLPKHQFLFNTSSLFVCGSPSGFFLLLRKGSLLPRRDSKKADNFGMEGVAGEQGTYGCIAVDNCYNVVNPYDPVAYFLNATVDVQYASTLKTAYVPSAQSSWLSVFQRSPSSQHIASSMAKPALTTRLPSTVELEIHDFTREEIAEQRMYLLNDNGQIDFLLKYGGGPLEIQYLTMLGAHSSYWLSKDFIRMIVLEVGREQSKEGTLPAMRAQKQKKKV